MISGARMLEDVARLSDPTYNGRQTGTADDARSGMWVAERFAELGLQPLGPPPSDSPLRGWAMTDRVSTRLIDPTPTLEFQIDARPLLARVREDYVPILDSPSVNVTAPIVFVGYGISDPARNFDEYAGMDVRDRVVLFLRGKPDRYAPFVTQSEKERVAREKGAVAFLTVTGPILNAYESRKGLGGRPLALYSQAPDDHPLPGAWISTELAEAIFPSLVPRGQASFREIQEQLNHMAPRSAATSLIVRVAWESREVKGTMHNVVASLPGVDTSAEDTIILGAHRDHFGRQAGLLFPGADDNGSGTAVLLEVARALAQSGSRPARSILFISFSGEEQGLLGSRLYVRQPVRPLKRSLAMINVDHAGAGNGRLNVGVTDLSQGLARQAAERAGLGEKIDLFGFFPGGDHVPFKEAGVPTITVVSGGVHPHFHQPSDTANAVSPDILAAAARYVLSLVWVLAQGS
jgi:hypothetical protein